MDRDDLLRLDPGLKAEINGANRTKGKIDHFEKLLEDISESNTAILHEVRKLVSILERKQP